MILVGHSLGASILLKYLSEEKAEKPVAGVFLVAPPYWGAEDWEVSEYALQADFASKIPKELPMFFYHSRDDEWVPFAHLTLYAENSRRQLFTSSMIADTNSTTICPMLLGTSKGCKGEFMEKTRSKDGTTIAFDRSCDGPPRSPPWRLPPDNLPLRKGNNHERDSAASPGSH